MLHTPPDEALAPEQREVNAFVKEAQRRGFPVRAGWLQSSRLSIPQMEELFSLLKKTCSEAVADGLASVLVEEFRDVKGSAFLKANRAWFERMQRRYDVSARGD